MGFWVHGMSEVWEKHFLPLCHDSRCHKGQKIKAQLLPQCAQAGCAKTIANVSTAN